MTRSIQARPKHPPLDSTQSAAQQVATRPVALSLLAALVLMLIGVALRAPTAAYIGPPDQVNFNNYIFQYIGAYSDITSLWFRDQLWLHPVPYFGYRVEYPVGMGMLIWLINIVNSGVMPYLYATAAVMIVSGLLVIWLGHRFEGANMWLLALSPALPLYIVLNWDMFSILLTVAALLLFRRDRDGWGALLLATAVWTKFFPIVLVPLVVLDRVLKRRWRDAVLISGVFGVASVLINAPFALEVASTKPVPEQSWCVPLGSDVVRLRESWCFFFGFNQQRPREVNFWNFFDGLGLTLAQINTWSARLLAVGVALIMLLMFYGSRRGDIRARDLLLPASLAAIAWFFFINKVYSPQYSLWLVALLALLAAPPALAVAFAGADLLYFAASFIVLYLSVTQNPATNWFHSQVMWQAMALREMVILALIVYAAWRIVGLARPGQHAAKDTLA